MKLKRTSGIIVPKKYKGIERIKSHLTRKFWEIDGSFKYIKFYEEFSNHILIPRFYPINDVVEDTNYDPDEIDIEANIVPRNERQKKVMKFLETNDYGIIQIDPGSGKTIMAINEIARYKKKTLIIIHKTPLMEQWINELTTHTNLSRDDIGVLTTKKFKECLNDKKVIMATIQTIVSGIKNNEEFIEEIQNSKIGLMIMDECHTGVGPEQFSKASLYMNVERVFGLSATPTRLDGNDDIIQYHLGEVFTVEAGEGELLPPRIYAVKMNFGTYDDPKAVKWMNWGGRFNLARYYKKLFENENYIKNCAEIITKAYNSDRTILVLCDRINGLMNIAKQCNFPKEDVGLFAPTSKKEERLEISDTDDLEAAFHTKKVIFSTYKAARDGNNRPALDTLVMLTPTSNIIQAIGRIQRHKEGKKQPLVIDLVDTTGPIFKDGKMFLTKFEKRKQYYKEVGWEITEVNKT